MSESSIPFTRKKSTDARMFIVHVVTVTCMYTIEVNGFVAETWYQHDPLNLLTKTSSRIHLSVELLLQYASTDDLLEELVNIPSPEV